jgi:hypothetical protein
MMELIDSLDALLKLEEKGTLQGLDTPYKIQSFLDTTAYRPEYTNLSPLSVLRQRKAHCLDGGFFAAAALRRIGYPPLLVDIFPDPGQDDDHVLAIFKNDGHYGAVAKSNFSGLRFRDPVYRNLRELVMSYFEDFYNFHGVKSLRTYTRPINLSRFDPLGWEWNDDGLVVIEKYMLSRSRLPLLTNKMAAILAPVDDLSYRAGMVGAIPDGVFKPQ